MVRRVTVDGYYRRDYQQNEEHRVVTHQPGIENVFSRQPVQQFVDPFVESLCRRGFAIDRFGEFVIFGLV